MKRKNSQSLFVSVLLAFMLAAYSTNTFADDSTGDAVSPDQSENEFYDVDVIHSGSEQVVVGQVADEASGYGFVPDEGFTVTNMALSGDGNNLWFITYNRWFPDVGDWQRLYHIDLISGDVYRSPVPLDRVGPASTFPFIYNLSTGDDGGRAVIEARYLTDLEVQASVFFDVIKGSEAYGFFDSQPFNDDGEGPFSPNAAGIRMSNNQNDVWWSDGLTLWRLEMDAINTYPDGETGVIDEACNQRPVTRLNSFDLSGGDEWVLFDVETAWDPDLGRIFRCVKGLLRGDETVHYMEMDVPFDDYEWTWGTTIESLNVAANDLAAYCIRSGAMADPAPCFLQDVGENTIAVPLTPVSDEWYKFTDMVLTDDGNKYRVVVSTNVFAPNGRSIIETVGEDDRRLTGTRQFGGTDQVVTSVQLSNDGDVMAGIMADGGVYVLRDGRTGLDGFPTIESITYRYDRENDTYIFRLQASSDNGISLARVQPMKDGIDPADYLPREENPFFSIRWGFAGRSYPVEGTSDLWELPVPMENSYLLLEDEDYSSSMDESWVLRFSIVDGTGSRAVFADISVPPLID